MRNARTADAWASGDPHDGPMVTTALTPSRASAEVGILSLVGRAVVWTGLFGLALGISCRSFSEGSAGPVGISLAQLGAPWVLVAFAAGVLVAERSADPAIERAALVLGGLAGAGTMVVASVSYYGDASSRSAVFWAAAGLVVGGAAGLAGAAWRARPGSVVGAMAAGALGLALVAEGIGRLDYGWFHSTGQVSHLGARWLVAGGLALPVLLTRGRPAGVVASISVFVLAAPVAAVVVVAYHGLSLVEGSAPEAWFG